MCAVHWPRRGRSKQDSIQTNSTSFCSIWDSVARFTLEIRASDFITEMIGRRNAYGNEGVMGSLDCSTLYALTRWLRPAVVVESGGFVGISSHSYQHMLWEFRQFWPRLRGGWLLVSHHVQMNAAFPEFVTQTYAHEKKTGRRDVQRTSHHEWGRWDTWGFALKKASR